MTIPVITKEALDRYVNDRISTGGFLHAVLADRLFDAVGRADKENLAALRDIVTYIYNELPGDCWGSAAKVHNWLYSDPNQPVA